MGTYGIYKYPKTPHLWGSKIAGEDKMLSLDESREVLSDKNCTYIWESKIDGTNLGIWFDKDKEVVQNRGHILGYGEHKQYNFLWSWLSIIKNRLFEVIGNKFVVFGEYCYAVHTIRYTSLNHYFNEFDIYEIHSGKFLDTELRKILVSKLVSDNIIDQVPIVHTGQLTLEEAQKLSVSYPPIYGEDKPEGLYLKVEKGGYVVGRYKLVSDGFLQTIIDNNVHWRTKPLEVQGLKHGVNILSPKL